MAHHPAMRIRETLHEDASGVIYVAKDPFGHKLHMRKFKLEETMTGLHESQQVAYQVAIGRLSAIQHPSLLTVLSGGIDPTNGQPYIAGKPLDGECLADRLKAAPLSIELATALLHQALEVSELLSSLLAEDGIWVETDTKSILLTEKSLEPTFVFWPNPAMAMLGKGKERGFRGIIELSERVLNWKDREIDEREGGHLQMWLKWLKEQGTNTTVRETREMLAAAAGVEPPKPVDKLIEECQRSSILPTWLPHLPELFCKWQAPKMPLFVLLSVMLVLQSIIGWMIVRTINNNIDSELQKLNADYTSTPYTIDRDPSRRAERGSQPLRFD